MPYQTLRLISPSSDNLSLSLSLMSPVPLHLSKCHLTSLHLIGIIWCFVSLFLHATVYHPLNLSVFGVQPVLYLFFISVFIYYFLYIHIQSIPKVLEHLQHFLDWLAKISLPRSPSPFSPSKQCYCIQAICAAHKLIYLQVTFRDVHL